MMMRRAVSLLIAAIVMGACSPLESTPSASAQVAASAVPSVAEATTEPPATDAPQPVSATNADAKFTITLAVPASQVTPATAIMPVATFKYLGPEESATFLHGDPTVSWSIHEVDGRRAMNGSVDTICAQGTIPRDVELTQDFMKSGEIFDDPTIGFDVAWFRQPLLRLPAGRWDITATLDLFLGDCGGERHQLPVTVEVDVVP